MLTYWLRLMEIRWTTCNRPWVFGLYCTTLAYTESLQYSTVYAILVSEWHMSCTGQDLTFCWACLSLLYVCLSSLHPMILFIYPFFFCTSLVTHMFILCVYRFTYFVFVSVVCCAGRVHPMPALCRGAIMSGRGAADWQARSQDNAIRKTGLLLTTPIPTPPPPTVICCFSRFSLLILNLVSLLQAINALYMFLSGRKKYICFMVL